MDFNKKVRDSLNEQINLIQLDDDPINFSKSKIDNKTAVDKIRAVSIKIEVDELLASINPSLKFEIVGKLGIFKNRYTVTIERYLDLLDIFKKLNRYGYTPCLLTYNGSLKDDILFSFSVSPSLELNSDLFNKMSLFLKYVILDRHVSFVDGENEIVPFDRLNINLLGLLRRISREGTYDFSIISKILNIPNVNEYNKLIDLTYCFSGKRVLPVIKNLNVPNYVVTCESNFILYKVNANILSYSDIFVAPQCQQCDFKKLEIRGVESNMPDMFAWATGSNRMEFGDMLLEIYNPDNYKKIKLELKNMGNPIVNVLVMKDPSSDEDYSYDNPENSTFYTLKDDKDRYVLEENKELHYLDTYNEDF